MRQQRFVLRALSHFLSFLTSVRHARHWTDASPSSQKLFRRKKLLIPILLSLILWFFGSITFWEIQTWTKNSLPENTQETNRSVSYLQDWKADSLPFDMTSIRLFAFPKRVCSIDTYGAINDGETDNTHAIASAIDDCANQGGGKVSIPPGEWVTGPIHLKSNIQLDIEEGAEILFSQDFNDYLPVVFSRYEGMDYYNYSPLIYARGCHDIAITGKGLLNGRGDAWWEWKRWQLRGTKKLYAMEDAGVRVEERKFGTQKDGLRPSFIQLVNCTRIRLEGFTIKNGPMWTVHPIYSDSILIRDITVRTEGPNNDGIVIDSSKNVFIDSVSLDTEDDAIVIKSGIDTGGHRIERASENIIVKNCHVGQGNGGVVIGSEMSGDVRNVFISHCTFDGTKRGLRIKSAPGRGGTVENIWAEDITMDHIQAEAIFLNMYYDSKNVIRTTTKFPTVFRNIFFKNIYCDKAYSAISLIGSEKSPIQNLSFSNIHIHSKNGIDARAVENLRFDHLDIQSSVHPNIYLSDVRQTRFTHPDTSIPHSPQPYVIIEGSRSNDIQFSDEYPVKSILRKK